MTENLAKIHGLSDWIVFELNVLSLIDGSSSMTFFYAAMWIGLGIATFKL